MSVAGDPFLAPRCNPDLILAAIRRQLFHHRGAGRQNVVAFQEAFTAWDGDGDRRLSHFEFEKALCRCGVFLPAQEINVLFRRFDTRGDGHADAEQALSELRVPLNKRRLAVVDAAFRSFAAGSVQGQKKPTAAAAAASGGGDGDDGSAAAVPLSEALARMKPDAHPEVVAGRLDPKQVKDDFIEFFTSLSGVSSDGNGGRRDVTIAAPSITLDGFRSYYRDVGVCEPYDSVFVPMMEALWGVKEPHPGSDEGSELGRLLQPKLLQHSHNAETAAEVFRKTLRYYSLDSGQAAKHGGLVDTSGVERALNSFGLYPNKQGIEGIFAAVGSPQGAPEEVDKIVHFLCPPEPPMAPMF